MKEKEFLKKQIVSFLLTLVLVPAIYAGTCFPLGLLTIGITNSLSIINVHLVLYSILFTGIAIYKAKNTQSKGVRYGIIFVLVASALVLGISYLLKGI